MSFSRNGCLRVSGYPPFGHTFALTRDICLETHRFLYTYPDSKVSSNVKEGGGYSYLKVAYTIVFIVRCTGMKRTSFRWMLITLRMQQPNGTIPIIKYNYITYFKAVLNLVFSFVNYLTRCKSDVHRMFFLILV